jgi:hypothetical protein
LLGASIREIGQAVAEMTMPQVTAQALHVFSENPTQKTVHAFIVVDIYYVHLQYNRSDFPRDLNYENFQMLSGTIKPSVIGEFEPMLQEGRDGEFCWLTPEFMEAWRQCTADYLERARPANQTVEA